MAIDDGDPNDTLRKLVDTITDLRAQLAERDALLREAEKALEPFATATTFDWLKDDYLIEADGLFTEISIGSYRSARALHEKLKAAAPNKDKEG